LHGLVHIVHIRPYKRFMKGDKKHARTVYRDSGRRDVLAISLTWVLSFLLSVSVLFAVEKFHGAYLRRVWDSYGIVWVVGFSIFSNSVLLMLNQRLVSVRLERSMLPLWGLSTLVHYAPYLVGLIVLTGKMPGIFGQLAWLPFIPFAMFVSAAVTAPERLRKVLGRGRFDWIASVVILFLIATIGPQWVASHCLRPGLDPYFSWWHTHGRCWEIVAVIAIVVYSKNSAPARVQVWIFERRPYLLMAGFFMIFFWLCLLPRVVVIIGSGCAGVLYRTLNDGTQTGVTLGEGLHWKWPWDKIIVYDVRVRQVECHFDVLSSNGLSVGVAASIRFHPKLNQLGLLEKEIGPNYTREIVVPDVQALVRRMFAQYIPEEIYMTKREMIQTMLQKAILKMSENDVVLDDLLILSIQLPKKIQDAIQSKLAAEQAAQEMRFRIDQTIQEKKRKWIEAQGVAEANLEVRKSLESAPNNDVNNLLRFKGIEATLELAKSNNAKVVVVGGNDRLPLILDTAGSSPPPRR
jgi:regulator of protease activity HflC (stomatin/prohibitin superfamily)